MSQELEMLPDGEEERERESAEPAEDKKRGTGYRNNMAIYLDDIVHGPGLLGREEQMALARRIRAAAKRCVKKIHAIANAPCCVKTRTKPRAQYVEGCDCRSCIVAKIVREKEVRPTMKEIEGILADHTNLLGVFGHVRDVADFNRFYEANLRLVIVTARKFGAKSPIPLEDRIQDGNIGLAKAIIKFNPALGNQFSTYATWWIRHAIIRAVEDKSRAIRLPVHFIHRQMKITTVQRNLFTKLGRAATPKEIAAEAEMTADEVVKHQGLFCPDPISLNTPIGSHAEGIDTTLEDHVASTNVVDPMADIDQKETMNIVHQCLRELPERLQNVIRARFGLNPTETESTLQQVGRKQNVSRERIRQLQVEALAILNLKLRRRGVHGIPL